MVEREAKTGRGAVEKSNEGEESAKKIFNMW